MNYILISLIAMSLFDNRKRDLCTVIIVLIMMVGYSIAVYQPDLVNMYLLSASKLAAWGVK